MAHVEINIDNRAMNKKKNCRHCGGSGKDWGNLFGHGICRVCHGTGKEQ